MLLEFIRKKLEKEKTDEGITDAETYFETIGEADELTDFPLDIVQLEKVDPIHAHSIRTK